MKMMKCKRCGAYWPKTELQNCANCNATKEMLEVVEKETSLLTLYKMYQTKYPNLKLQDLTESEVGTLQVYPLVLWELQGVRDALYQVLKATDEEKTENYIILYGSAALWLEGKPRPDLTDKQTIKDMDMGLALGDAHFEVVQNHIQQIIRDETLVGKIIPLNPKKKPDDKIGDEILPKYFSTSNANTIEFKSLDYLIQFSFSIKSKNDYEALVNTCQDVEVSLTPTCKFTLKCGGLKYISERLFVDEGLFRSTLFRSDKTEKILTYACMSIGYGMCGPGDLVQFLATNMAGATWEKTRSWLTTAGYGTSGEITKYTPQVDPLLEKLIELKDFLNEKKDREYYLKVVKENRAIILDFIRPAIKRNREIIKLLVSYNRGKIAKKDLEKFKTAIALELAQSAPPVDALLQITKDDAALIWQSEVGTGMLFFLNDQLNVVYGIITGCMWIADEHRTKLINGFGQFAKALRTELVIRLDQAEKQKEITPEYAKQVKGLKQLCRSASPSLPKDGTVPMFELEPNIWVMGDVDGFDAESGLVIVKITHIAVTSDSATSDAPEVGNRTWLPISLMPFDMQVDIVKRYVNTSINKS